MTGLFMQPGCAEQLFRQGLRNFGGFFRYADGEVIGGHRERNVARVNIGGLRGYLKREYFVPWKDYVHSWWAGFSFVSQSQREWQILKALQARGIPCPEPLAVGAQAGKAFLLLRELPDAEDLRSFLAAHPLTRQDRVWLAHLLGKSISDLHAAGFTHPDLYAKHVFVARDRRSIAFVDYQRTQKRAHVSWRRRCRDLAALNASLGDDVVSPRERWHCLFAYLRHAHQADAAMRGDGCGGPMPRPAWRELVRSSLRRIERRTRHLLRRRKVRQMRTSDAAGKDALVVEYWRLAFRGLDGAGAEPASAIAPRDSRGMGR